MKKKIVILTNVNFPFGGASANYLRNLARGLKINSNYHVQVWLQSGNSRPYKGLQNRKKNRIKDIDYEFIGGYTLRPKSIIGKCKNDFLAIINPIFYLLKNKKHIRLLIIYNESSYTTFLPLIICKLFRIKIIKVLPEWYEKKSIVTSIFKYFKWWDFIFGIKMLNKFYDGLIVLSHYFKNYYISKGVRNQKIIIAPNLVDLQEFDGFNDKRKDNIIRIGYSGTPVKKDGILDLLKAFRLLVKKNKNVELLIIGDISQTKTAIPYLKETAIKYGIKDNQIRFTGLIDFQNVSTFLNQCDILVLSRPSGQFAEAGFPTKIGEYLACQKPVVLTKVGDIPRYFTDKINAILVESDNPTSIYEGLNFLIENSDISKSIATRGYEWVKSNLEYKKASKKIIDFIESI